MSSGRRRHDPQPAAGSNRVFAPPNDPAAGVRATAVEGEQARGGDPGRAPGQYFTLQPYGAVLATLTGRPAVASVSAART